MQVSALLKFSVLFVPLLFAATVKAEIFTWKDAKGVSHYTNSMYDVPERYRSKAKKLDLGIEEKAGAGQQQQAAAPSQQKPSPLEASATTASPDAVSRPITIVPARPLPPEMLKPSGPEKTDQLKSRRSRRVRSGSSDAEE